MHDEFFIGWQRRAPERTARFLKRMALGTLVATLAAAVALSALQKTVASDARFDFGNLQEFRGVLVKEPVPMLIGDEGAVYLLVNPLKHGFDPELAAKHHLQRVTLRGTRIHRGGDEMIEAVPASVTAMGEVERASHPLGTMGDLGEVTMRGEIVDSKCYLGVMNPGHLKPHRACAINCIEGGVPPVLLVRSRDGRATYVLLVDENGDSLNAGILDFVAEPVAVTGDLKRLGNRLILFASPESIARE